MTELKTMHCEACQAGAPRVGAGESEALLSQLPGWQIVHSDGVPQLQRLFEFSDFQQAIDFTVAVGGIAEAENHHPAILTEWGRVTVSWWTHKINGLHKNDFVMAARTSEIYASPK